MVKTKQTKRKASSMEPADPVDPAQPAEPGDPPLPKRTGILNPRESRDHVEALTAIMNSFITKASAQGVTKQQYTGLVEALKAKCMAANKEMESADVEVIVNAVQDPTCAYLSSLPEERPEKAVTVSEQTDVLDPEAVQKHRELRKALPPQARETISDVFNHLAEARSTEGTAFHKLATLVHQLTPDQFMTVARLATAPPYQVTVNAPASIPAAQPVVQPTGQVTRKDRIRREILPNPRDKKFRKVSPDHPTRILAAVLSYRMLRSLREKATMSSEATLYDCKYNNVSTALTAALYVGRAPRTGDKQEDPIEIQEEEEEEREARQGPAEPRTQPDRAAKKRPRTEPSAALGRAPPEEEEPQDPEDLPPAPI